MTGTPFQSHFLARAHEAILDHYTRGETFTGREARVVIGDAVLEVKGHNLAALTGWTLGQMIIDGEIREVDGGRLRLSLNTKTGAN